MTGGSGAPGFSLVEMLVVVAVASVLAVGASLPLARVGATPADDARTLEAAAARLRARALVSGEAHALALAPGGWTAERRDAAGWQPIAPPERFRAARLAAPAGRLVLLPDGRSAGPPLRLGGRGGMLCAPAAAAPLACRPD